MYTVYKATDENGRSYIGYTSENFSIRKNRHLKNSQKGSKQYFHRALQKHNFTWEIILETEYKEAAFEFEKYFIKTLNTKYPNGYNMTDGGEGCPGLKRNPNQFDAIRNIINIPVIRSDGKIFPSLKIAAENSNTHIANIHKVIKGERETAGGFSWKRLDRKYELDAKNKRDLNKNIINNIRKKVIDSKGNLFHSITDAAKFYNTKVGQIVRVAQGKRKSYKGINFKYYKGENNGTEKSSNEND